MQSVVVDGCPRYPSAHFYPKCSGRGQQYSKLLNCTPSKGGTVYNNMVFFWPGQSVFFVVHVRESVCLPPSVVFAPARRFHREKVNRLALWSRHTFIRLRLTARSLKCRHPSLSATQFMGSVSLYVFVSGAPMYLQVPSEEMGRCVLRAWCQCAGYGGRARESVLLSVYRILDR